MSILTNVAGTIERIWTLGLSGVQLAINSTALTANRTLTMPDEDIDLANFPQPNVKQERNVQTGTSYTLVDADHGKLITCDNAAQIDITIPTGLKDNFSCMFFQIAAGRINLDAGAATLLEADTFTLTEKQYSHASVSQLGTSNIFAVAGRMAAT